ncbi:ABC transporter ATP-binding protein [Vineibacter terrae]|uniref:ABC transporter ATP-binding protein n=1 Tax=Vineibacter terrae TaxID=2586908 RepID=A0A5C8PG12_9HYPH|nr:ABC transporter ATP-binding protein [Vineibacter terrae]TXL72111.1 ABC transporter ATP-binding protein [Vineibacter terrae]
MASNHPVLEIRDLSIALPKGSDRPHAVEKVSVVINPGEIVCLVGESGSGKSVIAQAVMGLLPKSLPVTGGEIRLEGEEIAHATENRLRELRCVRMSMIFQEPMTALNPVMTCGDQIDEVLRTHTQLEPQQRKDKIIRVFERVSMPDPPRIYDSYPHQLSGGQRQRVMIAMALVLEPTLLIADEPTTALDVTTQAQILELIKDIQRDKNMGVLFITHDFGVVCDIAHRVAVLRLGELVEAGPTHDILSRPRHPYSRMLISSVPSMLPAERPRHDGARTVLRTEKLTKVYGGGGMFQKARTVRAVDNVSIVVRQGESLGIVGESGSGKSTVARCIARLIDPTEGRVTLGEDDVALLPQRLLRRHRRRIQIVFQDPYRSLNPRRTVGESIVEGPMNFGASRSAATQRARTLMETVRLDPDALDRYPHQFSGGQRQRICIARALAMEPEVLIADEAVSALDVSVQAQVLKLLDEIRERMNLAMLFITHDLRVAAQVCDEVAVMEKGKVVEYGPAADVFLRPQHAYTQALLAAAPGRDWEFGKFEAA